MVLELPPDRLSYHHLGTYSFFLPQCHFLAPNLCETITTRCYTFYPSNYLFQCLLIFHSQHSVPYPPCLINGLISFPQISQPSSTMPPSFMDTYSLKPYRSMMSSLCTRVVLGMEQPIGRTFVSVLTSFPVNPSIRSRPLGAHRLIFIGRRCFQLCANWEGNGRVVPRLVTPPGSDVHRIKVDESAGICITPRTLGGLAVTHLFSGVLLWSLSPVRVTPLTIPFSRSTPISLRYSTSPLVSRSCQGPLRV